MSARWYGKPRRHAFRVTDETENWARVFIDGLGTLIAMAAFVILVAYACAADPAGLR